jgi:hypothetical protein
MHAKCSRKQWKYVNGNKAKGNRNTGEYVKEEKKCSGTDENSFLSPSNV